MPRLLFALLATLFLSLWTTTAFARGEPGADLPFLRILLIVGTDSGDRGHPWRGNILVVVILSTGGHDGSTLGAVPGSR